jgi:hypothetical protein
MGKSGLDQSGERCKDDQKGAAEYSTTLRKTLATKSRPKAFGKDLGRLNEFIAQQATPELKEQIVRWFK